MGLILSHPKQALFDLVRGLIRFNLLYISRQNGNVRAAEVLSV